jgi:prevent-host-death family protein
MFLRERDASPTLTLSSGLLVATSSDNLDPLMYDTRGVDSIATITELRSETSDLIQRVQAAENGVLIQKNNEPSAVLIGWDTYQKIKEKLDLDRLAELKE